LMLPPRAKYFSQLRRLSLVSGNHRLESIQINSAMLR
jgi:hypothetical protein